MKKITSLVRSGPIYVEATRQYTDGLRSSGTYTVYRSSQGGYESLPALPRRVEQVLIRGGRLPVGDGETISLVEEAAMREYEPSAGRQSSLLPQAVYVIDSRGVSRLPYESKWARRALPVVLCALLIVLLLRVSSRYA